MFTFDEAKSTQKLSTLLEDARHGVDYAAAEIHREFVDRLVKLASKRINRRFQAKISPEEVVQSVFASFFRRNGDESYCLEHWNELWALLVKITVNKCINKVKAFDTSKRDIGRENGQCKSYDSVSSTFFGCDGEPSAQEMAIFNESLDELFDRIPEFSQRVVGLRLQGMSNFEIAESLNCSERTVYRSLNRIREIFLKLYEF